MIFLTEKKLNQMVFLIQINQQTKNEYLKSRINYTIIRILVILFI